MKLIIIILTITLLAITSCDTTNPKPPEEKPQGYQEDIPWPSLADSPWPMEHHDPQNSGRSPLIGPINGLVEWEFDEFHDIQAGLTVSEDSTLYAVFGGSDASGLVSLTSDGIIRWRKRLGTNKNYTAPLITANGNILCTDSYKTVYRIKHDSTLIWSYMADAAIFQTSFNIGLDGNIYFLDNSQQLYAIDSEGNLIWKVMDTKFNKDAVFRTAFSPDGKILYIPGSDSTINAFNIESKQIEWSFENDNTTSYSSPVVDSKGRIFFVDMSGMKSLNSNGELAWSFLFENHMLGWETPCIDKLGNLYFGAENILFSLDYDGKIRWQKSLNNFIDASIICDVNGNIYVGASQNNVTIFCFDSNGSLIWQLEDNTQIRSVSPLIGYDGILFLPLYRNKILKIN